jgi:tetratricopeptide (TPR) repeat protein
MEYLKYLFIGVLLLFNANSYAQNAAILSPDSLYNLGNVAFNQEKYDEAIFYYEKAKLLDPWAEDIGINLQLASEKLSTDIVELEPFFIASWWNKFTDLMLPGAWKFTSILLLLGSIVLLYFHYIRKRINNQVHFLSIIGLILFLLLISVFAGITRANHIFNSPIAIVFGVDQPLYEGPDVVSEKVKKLTGGNKLKVLDEDGDWYKVSAKDSEQGWIKKQNVKLIKF